MDRSKYSYLTHSDYEQSKDAQTFLNIGRNFYLWVDVYGKSVALAQLISMLKNVNSEDMDSFVIATFVVEGWLKEKQDLDSEGRFQNPGDVWFALGQEIAVSDFPFAYYTALIGIIPGTYFVSFSRGFGTTIDVKKQFTKEEP